MRPTSRLPRSETYPCDVPLGTTLDETRIWTSDEDVRDDQTSRRPGLRGRTTDEKRVAEAYAARLSVAEAVTIESVENHRAVALGTRASWSGHHLVVCLRCHTWATAKPKSKPRCRQTPRCDGTLVDADTYARTLDRGWGTCARTGCDRPASRRTLTDPVCAICAQLIADPTLMELS